MMGITRHKFALAGVAIVAFVVASDLLYAYTHKPYVPTDAGVVVARSCVTQKESAAAPYPYNGFCVYVCQPRGDQRGPLDLRKCEQGWSDVGRSSGAVQLHQTVKPWRAGT